MCPWEYLARMEAEARFAWCVVSPGILLLGSAHRSLLNVVGKSVLHGRGKETCKYRRYSEYGQVGMEMSKTLHHNAQGDISGLD
jgi:hypothetical protein